MQTEKSNFMEKKEGPQPGLQYRVATFGGTPWVRLLTQRTDFEIVPAGDQTFCVSKEQFDSLRESCRNTKFDASVWQTLSMKNSNNPDVWWTRLQFFVATSDIALLDVELADTALGHEFLRIAHDKNIPAYAVGTTGATSPILPLFVRGIIYPRTVGDIADVVTQELSKKER